MNWTIADARRRFAELLDRAKRSPQPIYRRKELVGVVISPEEAGRLRNMRREPAPESMMDALARLREICAEEEYVLRAPKRKNRRAARFPS
jgi:Antitoxin Phd_YefM, type II toxin-antitoxin system